MGTNFFVFNFSVYSAYSVVCFFFVFVFLGGARGLLLVRQVGFATMCFLGRRFYEQAKG
jgi:hypothetical protein